MLFAYYRCYLYDIWVSINIRTLVQGLNVELFRSRGLCWHYQWNWDTTTLLRFSSLIPKSPLMWQSLHSLSFVCSAVWAFWADLSPVPPSCGREIHKQWYLRSTRLWWSILPTSFNRIAFLSLTRPGSFRNGYDECLLSHLWSRAI